MLVSSEPDVHIHVYTCVFSGLHIILFTCVWWGGLGGGDIHEERVGNKYLYCIVTT